MKPIPETQPVCKDCGEYVECEDITGLRCSQCWISHEEELNEIARLKRSQNL